MLGDVDIARSRDVHETFQPETETLAKLFETRPRPKPTSIETRPRLRQYRKVSRCLH